MLYQKQESRKIVFLIFIKYFFETTVDVGIKKCYWLQFYANALFTNKRLACNDRQPHPFTFRTLG